MEAGFSNARLQKTFNDTKALHRTYGPERAKKIGLRMQAIVAAHDLAVLCSLPQARCHELHADRRGTFSLDLDGPYRLIIKPADQPPPQHDDGGIDKSQVLRVLVVEVTDTH